MGMKQTRNYIFPNTVHGSDIRSIRKMLRLSQKDFARFLCVSVKTVSAWEQSDREISGMIIPLIMILRDNLNLPDKYILPEQKTPLRLFYMYGNICCTVIDVNERDRIIEIHNYVSNPQFRAFGTAESPTYEQYCEFLESRCIPRSRDKLKLELDHLGVPFYDPLLIIEKTQGRIADDAFWIRLERI